LTDGEIIEIRHVGFEAFDEVNPVIGTTYSGPNFEDLEESVQDKFHDYLEERGINADLANYIIEAHLDKEQREYTSWLECVAHFVKK
jgi:complement component 1 Q subcomponent-binding protein, mitochondrial